LLLLLLLVNWLFVVSIKVPLVLASSLLPLLAEAAAVVLTAATAATAATCCCRCCCSLFFVVAVVGVPPAAQTCVGCVNKGLSANDIGQRAQVVRVLHMSGRRVVVVVQLEGF